MMMESYNLSMPLKSHLWIDLIQGQLYAFIFKAMDKELQYIYTYIYHRGITLCAVNQILFKMVTVISIKTRHR